MQRLHNPTISWIMHSFCWTKLVYAGTLYTVPFPLVELQCISKRVSHFALLPGFLTALCNHKRNTGTYSLLAVIVSNNLMTRYSEFTILLFIYVLLHCVLPELQWIVCPKYIDVKSHLCFLQQFDWSLLSKSHKLKKVFQKTKMYLLFIINYWCLEIHQL